MNKNSGIIIGFILVLLILSTSGCMSYFEVYDSSTVYESHSVEIQYSIRYGYWINCSGTGSYVIDYDCDEPEVLSGEVSSELLYKTDYKQRTLANNIIVNWNISGTDDNDYKIGIAANVTAESFLVHDLTGIGASTLQEIKSDYSAVYNQYCRAQTAKGKVYIDPDNPYIQEIAEGILVRGETNNTFLVAKELFIWLKENTAYKIHVINNELQTASTTLQVKTGDCDDLSFLYISLCRSIGIPARFIRGYLVEEDGATVSAVSHAWAEVFVGGNIGNDGWIPIECACPSKDMEVQVNQNFGLESAGHLRLFKDDGSNESLEASISGPVVRYDSGMGIDMTDFVEISSYNILDAKELTASKSGNRAYE